MRSAKGTLCGARVAVVVVALLWACASAIAETKIVQAENHAVTVTAASYTAQIDSNGVLTLKVKDAPAFIYSPPAKIESVQLADHTVSVRGGKVSTSWTFGDETIDVVTKGARFVARLDESVFAVIVAGNLGGPFVRRGGFAGSSAIVLSNRLTISYSIPMHVSSGNLIPSRYLNGSGTTAEDEISFTLRLGEPAKATDLLGRILIAAPESSYGKLNEGGNEGHGIVHFPDASTISLNSAQSNLSDRDVSLEYRLTVVDHYVAGKQVASLTQSAAIAPGKTAELTWKLPQLPSGFYYATVRALRDGNTLTEKRQTFTVDLMQYRPALIRPADFRDFWKRQMEKLAAVPMNAEVKLVSQPDRPWKIYSVTFDLPGGTKAHGMFSVADGQIASLTTVHEGLDGQLAKSAQPDFKLVPGTGPKLVLEMVGDQASRWKTAEDNFMLANTLLYVRGVDFLAAQAETAGMKVLLIGSSRSGAPAFNAAALRSDRVCGCAVHVPSKAGVSWIDKPLRNTNWVIPGGFDANDANMVRKLSAMAVYVDPVNHAPDVRCPLAIAYGVDDTLSEPQGIEAMYRYAASEWKRISRDAGGHQYSDGMKKITQALVERIAPKAASAPSTQETSKGP